MDTHPNRLLIERFYCAFGNNDWLTMADCYADHARFSDPVFANLDAAGARAMWHMLLAQTEDLTIESHVVHADDDAVHAIWIARYTFGPTARAVENRIKARFELADGKIVRHVDDFDLWRWSRQALGLPGVLFGWSFLFRRQLRRKAARRLERFRARADAMSTGI
ncbi:MAG TPA: nuclear transport factor 2 family protein, partial [Burkholderiaceae bacterium]|nr:nuclear transport factor 2 family protein [Burkholderiaceae bacterium]